MIQSESENSPQFDCGGISGMKSLTLEEVDGNGDLCTGAYAEQTLGCGHGNRPEVGSPLPRRKKPFFS